MPSHLMHNAGAERADTAQQSATVGASSLAALGNSALVRLLTPVHRAGGDRGAGPLSGELATAIDRERGGGTALPGPVREEMEGHFGFDFSPVRVHTGARSDTLNDAVQATAFTVGNDIFMGSTGPADKELLAHELTHVVQQATGAAGAANRISHPDEPAEVEARRVGRAVGRTGALVSELGPLAGNNAVARHLVQRCGTERHPGCECAEEEEPVLRVQRQALTVQRDDPPAAVAALPANAAETVGPRYAVMPLELRRLLARSVGSLAQYGTAPQPNLDGYLDQLEAAHLAAIVQVWTAADGLGFTTHMQRMKKVYAGSSWGFEFYGNSAALEGIVQADHMWCNDIQRFVRPKHDNTAHDWWRHCAAPVGQRGLHLGVDWGAGYVNLHYDSQNPAEGRQSDSVSAYLNPFVIGQMIGDPEVCNYDYSVVFTHNQDINSSGGRNFPAPFAEIPTMRYVLNRMHTLAGHELDDPLGDHAAGATRGAALTVLSVDLSLFDQDAKNLATSPTGEADATRAGITPRAEALQGRLITELQAMARLIRTTADSLGEPRSGQVSRGGINAVEQISGWPQVTTHTADDLAGSYYSLGEKRRLPAAP